MKPQRKRKRKREVREAKQRKRARERGNNDQIPSHPYQTAGRTHTRHHSRRTMYLHSPPANQTQRHIGLHTLTHTPAAHSHGRQATDMALLTFLSDRYSKTYF